MNDDPTSVELLEALSAAAREQAPDPRLEALLEGRLSADALAELEALAAADPHWTEALAAFTPLSSEAGTRIADGLVARFGQGAPAQVPAPARVLPFTRRPLARFLFAVVPLAAAAALGFLVLRPTAEPVPSYGVSVEGGERIMRSTEPQVGVPRLLPGSRLRIVLTPAVPTPGAVALRGWIVRDGEARAWPIQPQIAPNGAARVEGTAEALGLSGQAPGRVALVLAIGREAMLPAVGARAADLKAGATDPAYRLLEVEVELLGP